MSAVRPKPHRPPPLRRMGLAIGLALALLMVGMLVAVDLLRHPFPMEGVTLPAAVVDDPRDEIVCPQDQPVEGEPREEPQLGPAGPVEAVTSADLYDCPQTWHDRRVRFRGEAVGAVLRRGGHAWVQLNDDVYAGSGVSLPARRNYRSGNAGVGVLIPTELAERLERLGGPRQHGDVVEVVGTFRRIDPERREVAVIAADSGEVVAPGSPIDRPLRPDRAVAAGVLAVLAAGLVTAERVAARRR